MTKKLWVLKDMAYTTQQMPMQKRGNIREATEADLLEAGYVNLNTSKDFGEQMYQISERRWIQKLQELIEYLDKRKERLIYDTQCKMKKLPTKKREFVRRLLHGRIREVEHTIKLLNNLISGKQEDEPTNEEIKKWKEQRAKNDLDIAQGYGRGGESKGAYDT